MIERGDVLFSPDARARTASRLTEFARFVRDAGVYAPSGAGEAEWDYAHMHAWSIEQPESFWRCLAKFFGVHELSTASSVLSTRSMPGARWFEGTRLNYARYALRHNGNGTALVYRNEQGQRETLSYAKLRGLVAKLAAHFTEKGVVAGDRVVALLPNGPHAVVGMLATVSIGAVWSSCPPEFGVASVLDRFGQIAPKVLLGVENYSYGGKDYNKRAALAEIADNLPTLALCLVAPLPTSRFEFGVGEAKARPETDVSEVLDAQSVDLPGGAASVAASFVPEAVPFEHPLWILYSSGTTGKPKPIVHSHGGILLEHLKVLGLHSDLSERSTFFWYTTTGWMMWNYLLGGLLLGARIVLYDGSPSHPDLRTLWRLAEEEEVNLFGVSAPFLMACRDHGLSPKLDFRFPELAAIGSTGAPLPPEGFEYVKDHVKPGVAVHSVSGGTDLCTAFLLGSPWLPVRTGELSCAALGADVRAVNEQGQAVTGEMGELVLTIPMPSMPVMLWGDPDGERLRQSYFEHYPGLWRHGDWIIHYPDGAYVVLGRSDSTLNRGGVRMGTSEFYRALYGVAGVADSLVVDTSTPRGEGELWLFVVLEQHVQWDAALQERIKAELRRQLSPRHVPDRLVNVPEVPYTLSGKKLEVPVKRILMGAEPSAVVAAGTLRNPHALDFVVAARAKSG